MAAKLRSFVCSPRLHYWATMSVALARCSSSVCGSRLFSTTILRRTLVTCQIDQRMRGYHMGRPLDIKASELSNDKPLQKADVGCPICSVNISFSYKDVLFLAQFLSPEGNLLNKRITGVCGKQQRKLEKAIKISRRLGLLPKCGPVIPVEPSHSY